MLPKLRLKFLKLIFQSWFIRKLISSICTLVALVGPRPLSLDPFFPLYLYCPHPWLTPSPFPLFPLSLLHSPWLDPFTPFIIFHIPYPEPAQISISCLLLIAYNNFNCLQKAFQASLNYLPRTYLNSQKNNINSLNISNALDPPDEICKQSNLSHRVKLFNSREISEIMWREHLCAWAITGENTLEQTHIAHVQLWASWEIIKEFFTF